ncbi:LysM peptidoglycan-binding domain-containing protein [Priestia megaterium]|uniref:peptidoglycan-binding protein n=1 Tax=Priestia megaterium TaxID=1404 RepID=UPI00234F22A6|nr:peptidoglycan-binding protein [Priestia megaterium]MDC7770324.1 LysM peptidoglycan-binding domain-containing protein [Priestia megaterium]
MYTFEKLPQLVDKRGKLVHKGSYSKRTKTITTRVWHHSLTKLSAGGSKIESFADFHVRTNGWPEIAYHLIIDPKHVVNGKATIYYCVDISKKSYHVGNSNNIGLGICVIGDYRTDKLTNPTVHSIVDLHNALVADGIGKYDKAHNEMPGYSWKACCVFDYNKAFKDVLDDMLPGSKQPDPVPGLYTIQEGDTFWSIALKDGKEGITVEDLIAANPGVDPSKLKVGQTINFGTAQNSYTPKPETPKKDQSEYKYPLPSGMLKKGARGDSVSQLQKALTVVHFYSNKNAKTQGVDGIFGADTENALRRFQMVYVPYQVDGVYGPNTKEKLQAVLKSKGY